MKKLLKNKKNIIVLIVGVIIIISFLFIIKKYNTKKIENELIEITTSYYEKEFVELMPTFLKRNGEVQITLKTLKQLKKDISFFEKKKCNLDNTYVTLKYNEKGAYDVEIHLDCKYSKRSG